MMQQEVPRLSQAAIEALRYTSAFDDWNRGFDVLIKTIRHRVSPRDLQPLLKAGADETRIVTLPQGTEVEELNRFDPKHHVPLKSIFSHRSYFR
jgi:hypothetical protein